MALEQRGRAPAGLPAQIARVLVQQAFHQPAASDLAIPGLLRRPDLPASARTALLRTQVANAVRRFDYAAGRAASDALLADTTRLARPRSATRATRDACSPRSPLTRSIAASTAHDYLDCNVGHDLLDRLGGYAINFRDMTFVFR